MSKSPFRPTAVIREFWIGTCIVCRDMNEVSTTTFEVFSMSCFINGIAISPNVLLFNTSDLFGCIEFFDACILDVGFVCGINNAGNVDITSEVINLHDEEVGVIGVTCNGDCVPLTISN